MAGRCGSDSRTTRESESEVRVWTPQENIVGLATVWSKLAWGFELTGPLR